MEIKIIGSNCKEGMQLYKYAERASKKAWHNATVEALNDENSINEYGVKTLPGLVINNKLVSQGITLKEKEISKLIL